MTRIARPRQLLAGIMVIVGAILLAPNSGFGAEEEDRCHMVVEPIVCGPVANPNDCYIIDGVKVCATYQTYRPTPPQGRL